jgi:hypothetical protein
MPATTTEERTMTATTCTTRSATRGVCGKPAVYTEGEFAECAECAATPGSMASTAHMVGRTASPTYGTPAVGSYVTVHRYGKAYQAKVVEVGARGAVYVEWAYGNGATRRMRWTPGG